MSEAQSSRDVSIHIREMCKQNEELKEAIRYVEICLAKQKQQNGSLRQLYLEKSQSLEQKHQVKSLQSSSIHTDQQKIQELQTKYEEIIEAYDEICRKSDIKQEQMRVDIVTKNQQIQEIQKELVKLDYEINMQQQTTTQARVVEVEEELKIKDLQLQQLASKRTELEEEKQRQLDLLDAKGQGNEQFTEINRQNIKLMQDIYRTTEFQDYLQSRKYAEDTKENTRVEESEADGWIPNIAFKIAENFVDKLQGQLNTADLNKLISTVNKIWREKEKKQINKMRNQYNMQLMNLRHFLSLGLPYDEKTGSKKFFPKIKQDLEEVYKQVHINPPEFTALPLDLKPRFQDEVEETKSASGALSFVQSEDKEKKQERLNAMKCIRDQLQNTLAESKLEFGQVSASNTKQAKKQLFHKLRKSMECAIEQLNAL